VLSKLKKAENRARREAEVLTLFMKNAFKLKKAENRARREAEVLTLFMKSAFKTQKGRK
jgi:sRNA-binding regulator protein Hfq